MKLGPSTWEDTPCRFYDPAYWFFELRGLAAKAERINVFCVTISQSHLYIYWLDPSQHFSS